MIQNLQSNKCNTTNFDLYNLAIETFGGNIQKIIAIEELGELQKEIIKDLRGYGKRDNVLEEIADVLIMINQLKIMYKVRPTELNNYIDRKLSRLKQRIEEHK